MLFRPPLTDRMACPAAKNDTRRHARVDAHAASTRSARSNTHKGRSHRGTKTRPHGMMNENLIGPGTESGGRRKVWADGQGILSHIFKHFLCVGSRSNQIQDAIFPEVQVAYPWPTPNSVYFGLANALRLDALTSFNKCSATYPHTGQGVTALPRHNLRIPPGTQFAIRQICHFSQVAWNGGTARQPQILTMPSPPRES
jgi:hypothetical protein